MSPPELLWAQRSSKDDPTHNIIYLTINTPDLQPGYSLTFPTSSSISFKGTCGKAETASSSPSATKTFEIESLLLFGEIDLESDRKEKLTGKSLQVVLTKKDLTEDYWPRLTKDKRVNFVKTDFSLWVDQDEQNAVINDGLASTGAPPGAGMDMDAMMAQMGGMGGMGGMSGLGGMGADGMDIEKLMTQMKAGREGEDDSKSDDSTSSEEMPALDEPEPEPSPETTAA